jgi:hypothetical protein
VRGVSGMRESLRWAWKRDAPSDARNAHFSGTPERRNQIHVPEGTLSKIVALGAQSSHDLAVLLGSGRELSHENNEDGFVDGRVPLHLPCAARHDCGRVVSFRVDEMFPWGTWVQLVSG